MRVEGARSGSGTGAGAFEGAGQRVVVEGSFEAKGVMRKLDIRRTRNPG